MVEKKYQFFQLTLHVLLILLLLYVYAIEWFLMQNYSKLFYFLMHLPSIPIPAFFQRLEIPVNPLLTILYFLLKLLAFDHHHSLLIPVVALEIQKNDHFYFVVWLPLVVYDY